MSARPFAIKLLPVLISVVFPAAAFACPDKTLWGETTGTATGWQLEEGWWFPVIAGGPADFQFCPHIVVPEDGPGWFTRAPQVSLDVREIDGYRLDIAVESECDATLLVNTGAENWFYDDDDNPYSPVDPRIVLTRPSGGILDIWVGTYGRETGCHADVTVQSVPRGFNSRRPAGS